MSRPDTRPHRYDGGHGPTVPDTAGDPPRPAGMPPYWTPGTHIWWRYRRPEWQPGDPQQVTPVRVVADDAEALVCWLAPATPIFRAALPDGSDIRSAGLDRQFRVPRVQARGQWRGNGILLVSPTDRPWSMWVFWDEDWTFQNFYVNFEAPHMRDDRNTYSSDRVLDLVVFADQTVKWKDLDELEAAVDAGRYSPDQAEEFIQHAKEVEQLVAEWAYPFNAGWESWRPDPTWPLPDLPDDVHPTITVD